MYCCCCYLPLLLLLLLLPTMSFRSVELFQKRRDTAASLPPLRRACMNQDKSSRVEIPQYPRIFGWKLLSFKTISAPKPSSAVWGLPFLAFMRGSQRQPLRPGFYLHIDSILRRVRISISVLRFQCRHKVAPSVHTTT